MLKVHVLPSYDHAKLYVTVFKVRLAPMAPVKKPATPCIAARKQAASRAKGV